jgi:integrase
MRFTRTAPRKRRCGLLLALGKRRRMRSSLPGRKEARSIPMRSGKRIARLARRAGLPKVHLHSLRHGFAVLSSQAGMDLKTISSRLGHSSIRLTADTYGHIVESLQTDAAQRLDAFVKNKCAG